MIRDLDLVTVNLQFCHRHSSPCFRSPDAGKQTYSATFPLPGQFSIPLTPVSSKFSSPPPRREPTCDLRGTGTTPRAARPCLSPPMRSATGIITSRFRPLAVSALACATQPSRAMRPSKPSSASRSQRATSASDQAAITASVRTPWRSAPAQLRADAGDLLQIIGLPAPGRRLAGSSFRLRRNRLGRVGRPPALRGRLPFSARPGRCFQLHVDLGLRLFRRRLVENRRQRLDASSLLESAERGAAVPDGEAEPIAVAAAIAAAGLTIIGAIGKARAFSSISSAARRPKSAEKSKQQPCSCCRMRLPSSYSAASRTAP